MNVSSEKEIESGPKIGLFDGIPNAEYHGGPGISKSGLDDIAMSPAHYITKRRHPKPSTPAMLLGSAFHTIVLEPEKFDQEYCKAPDNAPPRPTAQQMSAIEKGKPTPAGQRNLVYWSKWDAENSGKAMLGGFKKGDDPFWKPGEWDTVHRMRDAVLEHPTASILLNLDDGLAEQTAYWIDKGTGKLCKCRPDFMNDAHNVIVDLKSTDDASFNGFSMSVSKWRYFVQEAFYMAGMQAVGQFPLAFIFVAVEKNPPYGVGVYTLDREARYAGACEYRRNLELFARCHEENVWPAYPTDIRDLELSKWQLAAKVR